MAAQGKVKKVKEGRENNAATIQRIVEELATLRADIEKLKQEAPVPRAPQPVAEEEGLEVTDRLRAQLSSATDVAILLAYSMTIEAIGEGNGVEYADSVLHRGLNALVAVGEVNVARLGYAFASVPKVSILRILLLEGALTSAQIGERAGLTTGSLYHHLRELVHAGVIESAGRNRHVISEMGRQTLLALSMQAARMP